MILNVNTPNTPVRVYTEVHMNTPTHTMTKKFFNVRVFNPAYIGIAAMWHCSAKHMNGTELNAVIHDVSNGL